jgi:diguanylate cyclase (GGDEF)-like protein
MQLSEAEENLLQRINLALEKFCKTDSWSFYLHDADRSLEPDSPILKLAQNVDSAQHTAWLLRAKDLLTGLWTKKIVEEILEQAIAKTQAKNSSPVAIAYLDIEKMKYINDMLGFTKGHEIIQEISQIIAKTLQPFHFAGRIGSDVFLVILNASMDETKTLMHKIQTEVSALMYSIGNTEVQAIIKIVLTQLTRDDTKQSCLFRLEEKMHQIHHATDINHNDIWIV